MGRAGELPALAAGPCGNNCADALDRLWEYLDAELGAPDAETVRAHLAECQGCLEEYDVDVVVKTLVRARLPGGGAGQPARPHPRAADGHAGDTTLD